MLCQICHINDATVHVTRITDGKANEVHYCNICSLKYHSLDNVIINIHNNSETPRLSLIKQAAKQFPNDPVVLYGLGTALYEIEKYTDAIPVFRKIIQLKSDYTAAYRELGKSLAKAEKIEEAKEIYQKGIEIAQQTGELQTGKEMKVFLKRLEKID